MEDFTVPVRVLHNPPVVDVLSAHTAHLLLMTGHTAVWVPSNTGKCHRQQKLRVETALQSRHLCRLHVSYSVMQLPDSTLHTSIYNLLQV